MPYGTWFPGQVAAPGVKVFNENVIVNGWVQTQKGISTVNLPTITTPGTIASGGTIFNTTGYDVMVYASATSGIGTAVTIAGKLITSGTVGANNLASYYLSNGASIAGLTYSGTLTWTWVPV